MDMDVFGIDVNIKEYCIACLKVNTNMQNLNDNAEKRSLFIHMFNIEFTDFIEYPNFLCGECDTKLNISYNFQENVRTCLAKLKEYNVNMKEPIQYKPIAKELRINEERQQTDVQIEFRERNIKYAQKLGGLSKIKIVPIELVNQLIRDFTNLPEEKRTCIICRFVAINRRALSSHMAVIHKEEKKCWCLECNQILENYEEHKKSHTKKYKCPFCNKQMNSFHYVEHLQSHAGVFECSVCNKTFKTASWLNKHKCIHTDDKPYICPNCSKSFIQLSSLKYHVNTHGTFLCKTCKKYYKTEKQIEEHECVVEGISQVKEILIEVEGDGGETSEEKICIVHSNSVDIPESQNFCRDCNRRVKSLNQHGNKYHSPKQPKVISVMEELKCEYCDKKYSNSCNLRAHIRTHMELFPYKCRFCDKKIINRTRLQDHERTHTGEKPFICNICGKPFSQSSSLNTHMRLHTGRKEVCEICNKGFCRKAELRLHLRKHKGEKPFLCTECGKTFVQKSHLTEHMIGHSEDRPFQCTYCQKAFKRNLLLKEHIKLHQGHKPFKCPSCPYACYKAYRLQQHMKQHNLNIDSK